jgi:LacI family transcriptional regulator
MSVTIKDIAREANISYSTVSRALAGHPQINAEVRNKIVKIAKDMGYTPNALAKGLVTKSTNTIGLILPDITNPFFPEVAQGVEDCANRHGYQVFLCNSNWSVKREKEYLYKLYSSRVDGIVISPASDELTHIVDSQFQVPTVLAAQKPQGIAYNYVTVDDFKSACIAVEYLIKLGHRKIAYIGGLLNTNSGIERFQGYKNTLEKNNIPIIPNYIMHGEYTQASGYQLAKNMLLNHELPTAIVAGNDITALGIIQAIEEYGLNVPKDISVIGFDDISFASLDKIQLTTVYLPKYTIGEKSVELLIKKIQNPSDKFGEARILEQKLMVRKTCRGI